MSTRISVWRWIVGGLLLVVLAAGCATGPQGGRPKDKTVVVNGTTYWDLDPSAGFEGINPHNYYYYRVTVKKGISYEEFGYYLTPPSGSPPKKRGVWKWLPDALSPKSTVGTVEYGWYACITHPPEKTASGGAGYVECGAVVRITHPPE